ncbi:AAA family ATPase [Candidatus Micrarchaeota archaeon]|nr:AAA family ATPase [Candidatus Micrarchaeota archaeon]
MPNYFGGDNDRPLIIEREEILLPDYVPDELIHRDAELQNIADSVKPLLSKRTPHNIFIHGFSGSGKTTCVKLILKQLIEHSSNVLPVYVNCWEHTTQMAVYGRIIEEMRLPLPRRGLAADEIFSKILEYIKNYKKPVLLVLDEIDGLRHDNILYVISRSNEKALMFGLIGISNNKTFMAKLDDRVRSSLRFSELEFKKYSEDQLVSILRTRAELALAPKSYDERILLKIVRSTDDTSARVALELLWKAAKNAEKNSRTSIMLQDIEDISSDSHSFKSEFKFSSEEILILKALEKGPLTSSELYNSLSEKIPKTKRQIRNYIDLLEKKGVIESEELESDGILKPKLFRLK